MVSESGKGADVGSRVRSVRKRVGISGRDLARQVGLSSSAISQIETGKYEPSIDVLRAIAAACGVDIAELFGEDVGVEYGVVDVPKGFLDGRPKDEWPGYLRGEVPLCWPGSLRAFVASAAAELAQLGPDEVGMLALSASRDDCETPRDHAGWLGELFILRVMVGSKGRPAVVAMVKREDNGDAAS